MEGDLENEENKGIIPRAVEKIFEHIKEYEENGWTFSLTTHFQEIYLE